MMQKHFLALKALIEKSTAAIKKVDWDDGQLSYPEKQGALPMPICLIDFSSVDFEDYGSEKVAHTTIILTLVNTSLTDQSPELQKTMTQLAKQLQGATLTERHPTQGEISISQEINITSIVRTSTKNAANTYKITLQVTLLNTF